MLGHVDLRKAFDADLGRRLRTGHRLYPIGEDSRLSRGLRRHGADLAERAGRARVSPRHRASGDSSACHTRGGAEHDSREGRQCRRDAYSFLLANRRCTRILRRRLLRIWCVGQGRRSLPKAARRRIPITEISKIHHNGAESLAHWAAGRRLSRDSRRSRTQSQGQPRSRPLDEVLRRAPRCRVISTALQRDDRGSGQGRQIPERETARSGRPPSCPACSRITPTYLTSPRSRWTASRFRLIASKPTEHSCSARSIIKAQSII